MSPTSSRRLLKKCGVSDLTPTVSRRKWMPATLKFMGAENYVLSTKNIELSLTTKGGGFGLDFRSHPTIPTNQLLGKKIRTGLLVDVVIVPPEPFPEMSLAALQKGMYPRVLRKDEVIHV